MTREALLTAALLGLRQQIVGLSQNISEIEQELRSRTPAVSQPSPSVPTAVPGPKKRGKRNMSAAARKRIAAAQKARWAVYHAKKKADTAA